MTTTTFFIIFVPILSILLLAINLILAPHNPYQEKDSAFECGYHSFLGQNRTQFSVSFFIFGLLFLLFDLEIVLVYPFTVSSYTLEGLGFAIIIAFLVVLGLGFVFEIGKGALAIDSKQTSSSTDVNTNNPVVYLQSTNPIHQEVELFRGEIHMVESGKKMRADAHNDPVVVRANADGYIQSANQEKQRLLTEIETEKNNGNITGSEADFLKDKTNNIEDKVVRTIKETSNTSVEYIDDSPATAHLMFPEHELGFVFPGTLIPLFIMCFNKNNRYLLSIYYNIHKNNIHRYATLLLVVCFVAIFMYS
jgi:NADH-ubiquinone oxidoreductase chain 3